MALNSHANVHCKSVKLILKLYNFIKCICFIHIKHELITLKIDQKIIKFLIPILLLTEILLIYTH